MIDVTGECGTTVTVALAVENNRPEPAVIACETRAVNGFSLDVSPRQFPLDPAETRPVSIHVGLPSDEVGGPADAGSVIIRGQDERDLVVWIRARVDEKAGTAAREATLIAESTPPSIRIVVSEDADGSDDPGGPGSERPDPEDQHSPGLTTDRIPPATGGGVITPRCRRVSVAPRFAGQ